MHFDTLIDFAQRYADLGWSIQEQFESVINGDWDEGKINLDALQHYIRPLIDILYRETFHDIKINEHCAVLLEQIDRYIKEKVNKNETSN